MNTDKKDYRVDITVAVCAYRKRRLMYCNHVDLSEDSKEHIESLVYEMKQRHILEKRKAIEWEHELSKIKNKQLRMWTACIIWWDFFERDVNGFCPWKQKYVSNYDYSQNLPDKKLCNALMDCGYTKEMVDFRILDINVVREFAVHIKNMKGNVEAAIKGAVRKLKKKSGEINE